MKIKYLFLMLMALVLIPSAMADGFIIDKERYVPETAQQAIINYQDGWENLLVSVQMDQTDKGAVWIFPIKANPEDTAINIMERFPNMYGYDVKEKANKNLKDINMAVKFSQLYPIPFYLMFRMYGGIQLTSEKSFGASDSAQISSGNVIVYETMEKYGMTTELLGAKSGLELHTYLKNKGYDIPFSQISILNDYINQDYTFVIAFVTNKPIIMYDEAKGGQNSDIISEQYPSNMRIPYSRRLGIMVRFPTDKPFFPMKPTSVYGSKEIPITIFVLGNYKPIVNSELSPLIKTTYKRADYMDSYDAFDNFFVGVNGKTDYTQISIKAPSKYFKEDFIFEKYTPASVSYAKLFSGNRFILGIILLILASALTGFIAGGIIFKRPLKYALIGLFNCLTIIGLIVAALITKEQKESLAKKGIFILAYTIGFLILTSLITGLLRIPF